MTPLDPERLAELRERIAELLGEFLPGRGASATVHVYRCAGSDLAALAQLEGATPLVKHTDATGESTIEGTASDERVRILATTRHAPPVPRARAERPALTVRPRTNDGGRVGGIDSGTAP